MDDFHRLRGHKGAVNCVQVSTDRNYLVSGSDDHTVRVWDLTSCKAVKCMVGCFESDIESIRFGKEPSMLYVACTKSVYVFDLRQEGLICRAPLAEVGLSEGGDEVSNIAINIKGDTLAVAMDSGVINLIPMKADGMFCDNAGATRYKRLSRVHTNIVSTVTFKKNNPRELLSGGFDYTACIWEADRGKPKLSMGFKALPMDDADPNDPAGGQSLQMVNPPFVMALEYVLGGRCIAAALGDGTVRILNSKDLSLNTAIDKHNCMITAFYADDCHIVTGGTDCMIHAYKLVVVDSGASSKGAAAAGGKKKPAPAPLGNAVLEVVPLFSIAHTAKLNALTCLFGPAAVVAEHTAVGEVVVGIEGVVLKESGDANAGETVFTAAETTATSQVNKTGDKTACPDILPASTAVSGTAGGVCRCCAADTSGEITIYTRSYS